ncbi:MAG: potassium transporter KefB [Bacteroidetes bacterium]|nr:MAG: potassium transporter KefB [Bacteroidota bacterium]
MDLPILKDVVIILGLSVLIILLFHRFRIPSILGFLLTGIIIGPHGLSLINAPQEVELMAEIGVIFLLFVIGIEISIKGMVSIKRIVFLGGFLQVALTIGAIALISLGFGLPIRQAVFMGFLFALSSTAIVLKVLQERGDITSPQGRVAIGILIFQDIMVVPLILFTPLLAGHATDIPMTLLMMLGKFAGIVVILFLLARYLVPRLLDLVVRTRNNELFLVTIIVICFATAWLTNSLGLSLALGAFFAGLIISESPYSHQATANILPFREIFISFFFVSIGMLLDLRFFFQEILYIHFLAIVTLTAKILIILVVVIILRYPLKVVLLSGLTLFQVGEFAFILSATGVAEGLLSPEHYQYFLAVSIMSMGATPFVIALSPQITDSLLRLPLSQQVKRRLDAFQKVKAYTHRLPEEMEDHLVIIGYGINGKNVAKAARGAEIPYVIVEQDAPVMEEAKLNREPVVFGDATQEVILKHVNAWSARVVVVAISDPDATRIIVSKIRELSDTVYIIVRTRHMKEIDGNLRLGADEVIPEEFETSIEIFARVLHKYLVPENEIETYIESIRADNYEMLRGVSGMFNKGSLHLDIPHIRIYSVQVQCEDNRVVGKSVKDSKLRAEFCITLLAIQRGTKYITHIEAATKILQDDVLYLLGTPENISRVSKYLRLS